MYRFRTARRIASTFKVAVLVILGCLPAPSHAQDYRLGATLDPELYATVPKAAPLARGDYLSAPARVSLKRWAPPVGDQGDQGSCVGWATAYAARTLLKAKKLGVDTRARLRDIVLSPSYVFNQIHGPRCDGSLLFQGLQVMESQGVAPLRDFPYDEYSCSARPSSALRDTASEFKIKGYTRLWGASGRNKHVATRRALANGNPVVIGMMVGDSFMRHTGSGIWRPSSIESNALSDIDRAVRDGTLGGHAMTLVGYDDSRDGGAFEVINSWGTGWGNDGYFWLSYDAFNEFVFEGYEVLPLDPPPPPRVVDMGGAVRVVHISGGEIAARRDGDGYRLGRPLPSGTRFRVEASSRENGYLYVIGGDSSGDYVLLFPRGGAVAPYAQGRATMLLPGPTEQHFTRLNDTTGTDFYVLLFAQKPLDPNVITQRMARGAGSVHARLRSALGNRLVPADEIELSAGSIGFEAASGDADVAAIVLSIDHVAARPGAGDIADPLIVLTDPAPESFDGGDGPIQVTSRIFRLEGIAQDESDITALRVEGALSSRYSSRGAFRAEIELPEGPGPHPVVIEARDAAGNAARRSFRFSLKF